MCYVAVEPLTVRGDEGEPVTYQAGEPIPEADHWDPEIKRAYLTSG